MKYYDTKEDGYVISRCGFNFHCRPQKEGLPV